MVAKLRDKAGGDRITVSMGDFGDFASHLLRGGRFLVEAFIHDLGRPNQGQRMSFIDVTLDQVLLVLSRHDAATQTGTTQDITLGTNGTCLYPVLIRYAWPSELDLNGTQPSRAMSTAAGRLDQTYLAVTNVLA